MYEHNKNNKTWTKNATEEKTKHGQKFDTYKDTKYNNKKMDRQKKETSFTSQVPTIINISGN